MSFTPRERYMRTFTFQDVDRVPDIDFGYWEETIDEWHKQGLPEEVKTQADVEAYFGQDENVERHTMPLNTTGPIPGFEAKVLEDRGDEVIMQDGLGVILRTKKRMGSIPQYLKFPVENPKEWEKFKERLDPDDPRRFPANWKDLVAEYKQRDYALVIFMGGFFGPFRSIMGLETLSMAYYDYPEMMHDMGNTFAELAIKVADKAFQDCKPDYAHFWEDMSYNHGSLVSPRIFREFLTPYYQKVCHFLDDWGIKVHTVDTDGNVNDMIGLFKEAGITGLLPFEVRAGSDVRRVRREHPDFVIMGGIDKIALAEGKEAIDKELQKLYDLLPCGGYIPMVDHRVPPDVPLENYAYYCKRKREILEEVGGKITRHDCG